MPVEAPAKVILSPTSQLFLLFYRPVDLAVDTRTLDKNHPATTMPYVFRQTDLPKLDIQVDRGSDFEASKDQWTSYCTLSGLAEESAATKVQVLTLCLSRETLAIVNNLGLTPEQRQDASAIITAIKRHIDGHINESVERPTFVVACSSPVKPSTIT